MRDHRPLVVTLILLAGCTGGSVPGGSVPIDDRVDRDCDGRLSSFTLDVSLSYSDSADVFSETDAVLCVEAVNGGSTTTTVRTVDDLPLGGVKGRIDLTGVTFPRQGSSGFRSSSIRTSSVPRLGGDSLGIVSVKPRVGRTPKHWHPRSTGRSPSSAARR